MNLKHVEGTFAVARLPHDAALPGWLDGPGFTAVVRSDDELTIVCADARVPPDVAAQKGWNCFRSVGPFGFDEAGIVASLIGPISARGIGVFVVCTFDGEHILYPSRDFAAVRVALEAEGHVFVA